MNSRLWVDLYCAMNSRLCVDLYAGIVDYVLTYIVL